MRRIFENVIRSGKFDLTTMLQKIDEYHVMGKLKDTDRDELYAMARGDAKPVYDVQLEIEKLWAAIRALQGGGASGGEAKAFVQPTGAHDAYNTGDRVLYKGTVYVCRRENCVWAPDVPPYAWDAE